MIVTPEQFPLEWLYNRPLVKRKRGNQRTKKRVKYKDIITAFDIETTRLADIEQSVMYVWQWQFDEDYTVVGRTWEQFVAFQRKIAKILDDSVLVVFVHNLSYEFQFLRGIYKFSPDEVFAIKSRKVLKCNMHGCFEFRCSYEFGHLHQENGSKA